MTFPAEWSPQSEEDLEGWEGALNCPTAHLIQKAVVDLRAAETLRSWNGVDPYSRWRTKEGVVMNISDMTDRHLYYSLRMVFRDCNEVHPGLNQEWRRRGKPEESWRTDPPPSPL